MTELWQINTLCSEPLDSSGVSEQSDSKYYYYDDDSDSYETEEYEESSADYEDS